MLYISFFICILRNRPLHLKMFLMLLLLLYTVSQCPNLVFSNFIYYNKTK